MSGWIQTYTGRQFWPLDPRPENIMPEDIAHALSMLCRFGGHCSKFYSVAEHSLLLAEVVEPNNRLWALLHDASEAYLVDVPRPLKRSLVGYKEAEDRLMQAICTRFGLHPEMPEEVHLMDTRIIMDERLQLMSGPVIPWPWDMERIGIKLKFLSPEQAEEAWLLQLGKLV